MWIYSWCSSRHIHVQTHCTLQLSVQWVWSLEILWADEDLLLMLLKRHTWSNSLHTSVKCAESSPDMIKVTAHFNELCSEFDHLKFCEQMWIYFWCHTWSNSLHTSVNCAVTLLTWNFVSRCGQMFLEYRSACVYGNIRLLCKELVWEEMDFKWNDQLYMLHAKVGSLSRSRDADLVSTTEWWAWHIHCIARE